MIKVPKAPGTHKDTVVPETREALLEVVDEWILVLAGGDYKTAYEMTFHPEGEFLTLEIMKKLIKTYTNMEGPEDCYVTLPEKTTVRKDVDWLETYRPWEPSQVWYDDPLDNGQVGEILYTMPLNGEWSDVTAIFCVLDRGDHYVLHLEDIHVM